MAELTTKTGNDVATEVKRQFGDEDGIQVTDADILRWINSAQRSIVSVNPVLQDTIQHDITGGVADYSYPADRIQYIQTLYYQEKPLTQYSYNEAVEYIKRHNDEANATVIDGQEPLIWWEWAQNIHLYPKPKVDAPGALRIDYVRIPVELTALTDALDLPDRYLEAVIYNVLAQARSLDETYDAAGYYQNLGQNALSQLSEQENKVQIQSYPTITVSWDDL